MADLNLWLTLGAFSAVVLIVGSWVTIGRRMWRQGERNAFAEKLARDEAPPKGPFAVYLRAFRHPAYIGVDLNLGDQLRTLILSKHTGIDGRNGMRLLESVLAEMLDKEMPLVGLGRPNSGREGSGAGLVRTTDDEWKQIVTSLLDRCDLIVMTPAGTGGTAWEIEQLGARRQWAEKAVYFMPNYQVELIRALQPFVSGYETWFGTSRRLDSKKKPKHSGSVIVYAFSIFPRAIWSLAIAMVRFVVDISYGGVILFTRFAKSFSLRGRWGKARQAGRRHGLKFPSYTAKGRLFSLDEQGKPQKLADLNNLSSQDLHQLKAALLRAAESAAKRRERAEREAAARLATAALTPPESASAAEPLPAASAPLIDTAAQPAAETADGLAQTGDTPSMDESDPHIVALTPDPNLVQSPEIAASIEADISADLPTSHDAIPPANSASVGDAAAAPPP